MSAKKKITIAIDGPAGSGKSTTARKVAEELGYQFLDSGAMYRSITYLVLRNGADPYDQNAAREAAQRAHFEFKRDSRGERVILNGEDVTDVIRMPLVTNNIAPVAANPAVRAVLVDRQRELGKNGGIVAEGRDIGTVVFGVGRVASACPLPPVSLFCPAPPIKVKNTGFYRITATWMTIQT